MDRKPAIDEPGKKPRRRWYQFGLRTLLIIVTACAIFCPLAIRFIARQNLDGELQRRFDALVKATQSSGGGVRQMTSAEVKRFKQQLLPAVGINSPCARR